MRHLQRLAVALDAARHVALLAHGELPLDELALGVEEHEIEAAAVVLGLHLVGGSSVAAGGRLVFQHAYFERGDAARRSLGDGGLGAAVDHAVRQMPQEIEHARLGDARRQREALLQEHD